MTTATLTAGSLREHARQAWQEQEARRLADYEEEQARTHAQQIEHLREFFAAVPAIAYDPQTGTATADGLIFHAASGYRKIIYLEAPCGQCGQPLLANLHNLAQLGQALEYLDHPEASGSPFDTFDHSHPKPPPPLDLTDQERDLVIAVRALLGAYGPF